MGVGVLSIFKKIGGGGIFFFPKRREQYMIVAYLYVCKSKDVYNLRYKSNKFQYTP